jgi:hypothetical protein
MNGRTRKVKVARLPGGRTLVRVVGYVNKSDKNAPSFAKKRW